MKKGRLKTIVGMVFFAAIFVHSVWLARGLRRVKAVISHISPNEVECLFVFIGEKPNGSWIKVEDKKKIGRALESLRAGDKYSPQHETFQGFARYVVIAPQELSFKVWQGNRAPDDVVVKIGEGGSPDNWDTTFYGYLHCREADFWQELGVVDNANRVGTGIEPAPHTPPGSR